MAAHIRSVKVFGGIVAAMLALPFVAADARVRQDARTLPCGDVRELVFARGAIVITTGERTFERFVESQQFCQPGGEIAVPAFVATRDNKECWIGYVCRNRTDLNAGQ